MKKKFIYTLVSVLLLNVSCNDYLDELPDNRTTLDSKDKIEKILISAYPSSLPNLVTELSSDNIDDSGASNPNRNQFYDDVAYWKHSIEVNNDDLKSTWGACYLAIANANEALNAIEELGNPESLNPQKGEALLARAYAHFLLVNLFGNHYNEATSATDLGVVYMEKPEKELSPKYQRETVKSNYEKINADIEAGLPLIEDTEYEVPKYHFNKNAAYAFAARFNLYYEKWDKAIEYANALLGTNPKPMLRDWEAISKRSRNLNNLAINYTDATNTANLLLLTDASLSGYYFGAYYTGSRYNHVRNLADRETYFAPGPWGNTGTTTFWSQSFVYSGTNLDKVLLPKTPMIFQYTDLVAGTGYVRTLYIGFSTDEALLNRAEAYIMKKEYDKAVADLNVWSKNFLRSGQDITQAQIETFYDGLTYSSDDVPTQKKKLSPKFTIEAGTQENLLHCVLQYRRLLTIHEGLRWYDIRRYGIEVVRYQFNGTERKVADKLTVDDLRRTLQIPQDVIKAGLTPNPR